MVGQNFIGGKESRSQLFHFKELNRDRLIALEKWRQRRAQDNADREGSSATLPDADESSVVILIKEIYKAHNPDGLVRIPALLDKYKGKEAELLSKVQDRYCPVEVVAEVCDIKLGSAVFMTFNINGIGGHTVKFRLYDSTVPLTCENFKSLCIGDRVCKYILILLPVS